jgi:hypothetical protein
MRKTVLWSLIAIVLASAITFVFQSNALASLAVSTVAVEFCLGKAGVHWTTVPNGESGWRLGALGAGYGAALGLGALLLTARGVSLSTPELSDVATGLISALLLALRSELVEHALIRHALGPSASLRLRLPLMVLATIAWTYGSTRRIDAHGLAAAAAIGAVSAALWQRHAFTAISARFAFVAVSTVIARNTTRATESTAFASIALVAGALGLALWLRKTSPSPAVANVAG